MPKPKILVTHPGRQHSHRLAMALADRGMLARYVTGVPACGEAMPAWQRSVLRKRLEASSIDLDPRLVRHVLVAPTVRRIVGRVGSPAAVIDWGHRAEAWFDRIAAKEVRRLKPDVVVCYENAALETFRAAKRLGVTTVLDAASIHHQSQDRYYKHVEIQGVHRRICRRKDEEIALADHFLSVSAFAKESYVEGGVEDKKIHVINPGADTTLFDCPDKKFLDDQDRVRFVQVGHEGKLKGWDLSEKAANYLSQSSPNAFTLTSIGASNDLGGDGCIRRLPRLNHRELSSALRQSDVLVHPSRFDAWPMAVIEAMAAGLPAIVSRSVGNSTLISPRKNGLVVEEGSVDAIANAMLWFLENRRNIALMSTIARSSAAKCDWSVYNHQVVEVLSRCAMEAGL